MGDAPASDPGPAPAARAPTPSIWRHRWRALAWFAIILIALQVTAVLVLMRIHGASLDTPDPNPPPGHTPLTARDLLLGGPTMILVLTALIAAGMAVLDRWAERQRQRELRRHR